MGVSAEISAQKGRWPRRGGLSARRVRRHPATSALTASQLASLLVTTCMYVAARTASDADVLFDDEVHGQSILNLDAHDAVLDATDFLDQLHMLLFQQGVVG